MRAVLVIVLLSASSYTILAQENPGKDPMQDYFFPPELVMRYQNEIQLKKEQRITITSAIEDAQKRFSQLQLNLQTEATELQKLLSQSTVNEASVLSQLDKVLDQERAIKKAQITLMVKIKNELTDDQKNKLNSLKGK
ncbi:MAG: periplasmic heavy metal sensor [Flammeovirgaceae bacterium]|nr:periplasmic heavy metal sensor [Flammeovirgaceae bacterium]